MGWLLREDQVLASIEVADSAALRTRGLLGRDHLDGALLLKPAKGVHTVGMRFAIDVAYLDKDQNVIGMSTMAPHRVGMPRLKATQVVEAQAGSFQRWDLQVGDQLVIRL